jgi:DNA-binding NarL/FixJ family response regulator
MSPGIARRVINVFHSNSSKTIEDYKLTAREKEILYSLVDGLSYNKIAEKYFVSLSTIRTHICNIYQKLHVNSKSQAVAKVLHKPNEASTD